MAVNTSIWKDTTYAISSASSPYEYSIDLKTGRQITVNGVTQDKELNFCVRNGNRWILFAIITAMVIYSAFAVYIRL